MNALDVAELVRRAQAGDESAFGVLASCFERAVFGIALKQLRNEAEAEELRQDVFIHAQRKLGQLRECRAFAGWLKRMTVRMAINRLSRRRPGLNAEPEFMNAVMARGLSPAEELERKEARARVRAGMSELKVCDRNTLEMFYFRGRSIQEIAEATGAPVGTIKRRLHVARSRLKGAIENSKGRKQGSREPSVCA